MGAKELLLQWWRVKNVTKSDGTPVTRTGTVYSSNPFCTGFHLDRFEEDKFVFSMVYYEFDGYFLEERRWHTSLVIDIEENDDELIVKTRNSIYTFIKTKENPFTFYSTKKMN